MEKSPHIVIIPTPGMGHLIPLIQFSKRLLSLSPHFTFSFLIPSHAPPSSDVRAALSSLPASIDSRFLPPVSFDDLPPDTKAETMICLTITRSLPAIRESVAGIAAAKRLVAVVGDLFATDVFEVAREFDAPPYIFFPGSAMALSMAFYLPHLDRTVSCAYREMDEPFRIPGCIPVRGVDLHDPLHDRKNDAYKWMLHHANRYNLAEGIMVNSFRELEEGAFYALQETEPKKPPIYPVGPLVQESSRDGVDGGECLKWLDEQPRGSVLFVSFGSGGTLSSEQLNELAYGLEMSQQRFLWVVRRPNDKIANATYFSLHGEENPLDFLPKGFLERTKSRGLAVPSWVPQIKVLSHSSTGGFITHCGWNSILESVVHGVPLIAWPLYAEQRMNAVIITDGLKVALRVKARKNGLISGGDIVTIVRNLMEGEEGNRIRGRMIDLKEAANKVLSEDGSSTKSLSEVALKWKSYKNI